MTIDKLINQYLDKEVEYTDVVRQLSGIFRPEHACDLLAIINQVTRHKIGEVDTLTMKDIWDVRKIMDSQ